MYHRFKWTRKSSHRNQLTKHYEPLQPHLLAKLASHYECVRFLDVGSNIGAYSLFLSTLPTIKEIHAFEPSPETFAELEANVALNSADIQTHKKAVSDRAGLLQFGIVNMMSGANSVINTSIHNRFQRQIEVETVRIDDLFPEKGQRACVKIDIEGHESVALAGMSEFLSRNEVVIQVEDYGKDSNDMESTLKSLGFQSLFRVGVDRYFSNIQPTLTDQERVRIFEAAADGLVEANLADLETMYSAGVSPVTIPFGTALKVQLHGRLATFVRTVFKAVRLGKV